MGQNQIGQSLELEDKTSSLYSYTDDKHISQCSIKNVFKMLPVYVHTVKMPPMERLLAMITIHNSEKWFRKPQEPIQFCRIRGNSIYIYCFTIPIIVSAFLSNLHMQCNKFNKFSMLDLLRKQQLFVCRTIKLRNICIGDQFYES